MCGERNKVVYVLIGGLTHTIAFPPSQSPSNSATLHPASQKELKKQNISI